jgi:hypothetical protein
VPIAEIADVRPGRHSIDGSPAPGDFLLPHPDRDQRQPWAQLDPNLEGMPRGLPDDRQGRAIGQEQRGVLEVAALGEAKAQFAAQLTLPRRTGREWLVDARSQPHSRHEGQLAGS